MFWRFQHKFVVVALVLLLSFLIISIAAASSPPGLDKKPETPGKKNVADMILVNGKIYTMNDEMPFVEALAVKDGTIMALGKRGQVQRHFEQGITEVIDLHGKMVLPGFIDSHCHPPGTILREMFDIAISWRDCVDTIISKVTTFVEANPDIEAYYGGGWSIGVFDGLESTLGPKKERLDAISADKPIILRSYDGHSTWVNSRALEIAGIDADTPDPAGGVIVKDPDTGEPWGTLNGAAAGLLPAQEYTSDQVLAGVRGFQDYYHSFGHTGIFSAGMIDLAFDAFKHLEDEGELNMWVMASGRVRGDNLDAEVANLIELSNTYDGELFKVTNAKIFMDGVVEGVTAKLLEPYEEAAGMGDDHYGIYYWPDLETLDDAFELINNAGFQVHVHSIGDRATREVLNAYEASLDNYPGIHRNAITHLQLVHSDDIPRFAELGVIANVQAYWHLKEPWWWEYVDYPFLGDRAEYEYPLQSLISTGAVVASSSDYPVTDPPNPLWAIEAGVTRNLNNADFYEVDEIYDIDDPTWLLNANERASLEDMIKSFTINNAYALFLDDVTGSIEIGKYADLVILDQDLFSIDPLEIDGVQVRKTIFRGKVVYEAE